MTIERVRVAVDLDGTICALKQPGESYADVAPLTGAAERLRALRAAGCYIILLTARNMETCEGNLGRVMKNVGKITHNFVIARHQTPILKAGKSAVLNVTLKKGKYKFICSITGHATLGMKGTLLVT